MIIITLTLKLEDQSMAHNDDFGISFLTRTFSSWTKKHAVLLRLDHHAERVQRKH